ncbi:MAG: hypothetical protein ABI461_04890 [Polyangiaceae bacterium]
MKEPLMHLRSLRSVLVPALFFVAPLWAVACTEGDLPRNPVVRFQIQGDAPPNFLDVPFPSDVYLQNQKVIDPIPGVDAVIGLNSNFVTHELGKQNGFSRIAMSAFYIDDPSQPADPALGLPTATIDPKSLPVDETACTSDKSSVFLLDLSMTDPTMARVPCRALFHVDDQNVSHTRPLLAIGPARGIVLQEAHQYATVITSRVTDMAGHKVLASDGFAAIASAKNATTNAGAIYGKALGLARTLLASTLKTDGAAIVGIAPFTTNAQSGELYQAREIVEAAPAPTLKWDAASLAPMGAVKFAKRDSSGILPSGFTASLDEYFGIATDKLPDGTDDPNENAAVRAHDTIAAIGTAEFDAINFLTNPGNYATLDSTTFVKDATGKIIPAPDHPTERIWATVILPTAPMPATGYPVVIVQHGLAGYRGYAFSLANTFTKNGWAVVAIDSYPFGSRAPEPQFQVDANTDYEAAPGATYKGPDGMSDQVNNTRNGAFDMFGGLKNLGAFRDQLRQAALDTSQLVRALRNDADLSSLKTGAIVPKFDGEKIGYIGDSLGGIEGAIAAAIEPHIQNWFLNVAGGGMIQELATHGPSVGFSLSAAANIDFGFVGDTFDEGHPLVFLGQAVVDAGDPLTFAKFLIEQPQMVGGVAMKPRNILQTEVIYDELVSNESDEALARAAGYGMALPNVGSNAGVLDMKDLTKRAGAVSFANIAPDANGAIHDTPIAGITAVMVQISPATHGEDLVSKTAKRMWSAPFTHPFDQLDTAKQYRVRTSYQQVQAAAVTFLGDGFSGSVPKVAGFVAPIRDVDDDGTPDDVDPDPNDPQVH